MIFEYLDSSFFSKNITNQGHSDEGFSLYRVINIFNMSQRGGSRGSLPTISNPQLNYSQRYEHMTKLANYSEMN